MTASVPKRRYFGTDGVRDIANSGNMTAEFATSLGRAYVDMLRERGASRPTILVCRDTRRSGPMLEAALAAGMMSAGADVRSLGVFPTPGVSFVLRRGGFDAGAVVSASHNPAEYNGIKFFEATGSKLTDEDEAEIESRIGASCDRPTGAGVGAMSDATELRAKYLEWLRGLEAEIADRTMPLVVDAANGAACDLARELFGAWPGGMTLCGVDCDGMNINDGVGVMCLDNLARLVREHRAKLGIAYDGDADRVLLCDSAGRAIDGDIIMWIVARCLARRGELGTGLVATVMSNMALEEKLSEEGIKVFRCPVGDRYVLERMREVGSRLGGEQSGHVIASDYAGTGDGLCTGLFFIRACEELGEDISTLNDRFPRYPQVLKNLRLDNRAEVLASAAMREAEERAERKLAGRGRILLRTSGTEPLLRILVEAKDSALMHEVCSDLEIEAARISAVLAG